MHPFRKRSWRLCYGSLPNKLRAYKEFNLKNLERRIKQHLKAPILFFKANAHTGFENTLAKELSMLGISQCEAQCGAVYFKAKLESVWQAIALSRCARNFEMKIAEFHCENFRKLEREIETIAWELYLPQGNELNIKTFCEKSRLYHKGAVEERVAATIRKRLEGKARLRIHLKNDVCSIWLDLCGLPLHKRGERWVEDAPMQETLCASILLYANFAKYEKLIDPMAGSGVFSLEAAKWRLNHKLKLARDFDFMKMPAFRAAAFNNFLQKASQPFALADGEKFEIFCSDKNPKAIKTIKHNLHEYLDMVSINQTDFFSLPPQKNALLVLNPPYGKRLGREKNLYMEIIKKIEKDFIECKAAILCPLSEASKIEGFFEKIQTYNGGLKTAVLVSA
jgi:putative N6-adenine-specific DNA methylase